MKSLAILIAFVLLASASFAQRSNEPDTSKWLLQLPRSISSPRFLLLFTKYMEDKFPFLTSKEICLDCNAATTITLHIDTAIQKQQYLTNLYGANANGMERYRCTTTYNFSASIEIMDHGSKASIVLVDSTEDFEVNREFFLKPRAVTNYPQRRSGVSYIVAGRTRTFESVGGINMNPAGIEPEDYVKDHEKDMLPRQVELEKIIKVRISPQNNN